MQSLCKFILFRLWGWKVESSVPARSKCILCVAPHTSNLDFIIGQLYYTAMGRKAQFLMKKDWFFWPLGVLLRKMGGIAVNRSRKTSLTDQLADIARTAHYFNLAVTPEGTRSLAPTWKRGFYFIAQKANIPIQLYALDFKHRTIVCTKEIVPSQDMEADLRTIMEYYRPYEGCARHPEKFSIEVL